ncbi:MAG: prepilin-type N-terminal cleavage/methylation domain-containing protein [Nostocales cyanobacterium]|nr:MAG: prepilin-type N-terminal cleavage/methylation domain-containing protein [Nostocales cyanobacterium]TAF18316.1 MAG: prepilin-type N-terminal cleavage/methylation domain-containing protein [Nostocales cyanobacterium]
MNKHRFHPDSGFTLLEVVVGIVVVTFFTAATMQMLATSAMFKARAKEFAAAANFIQKDLEAVRSLAGDFKFPTVGTAVSPPNPAANTVIQLSGLDGIRDGDKFQFTGTPDEYPKTLTDPGPPSRTVTVYTLNTTNKTITINSSPGLQSAVRANAVLVSKTLCGAGTATGIAAEFQTQKLPATSNPGFPTTGFSRGELPADYADYKSVSSTPEVLNDNQGNPTQKKLWVMRKITPIAADVLNVRYLVVKDNNGTPSNILVNQLSSEVIPNAAYQCIKN